MLSRASIRKLSQPTVVLVSAAIMLPFLMFALAAWQDYRATLRETDGRAERTARILREHALKVLETQRLVVEQIRERLVAIDWSREGDRADLHQLLARLQSQTDQVTTITITDAAGRMRASGRVYPADPAVGFDDREWFQAVREQAVRDQAARDQAGGQPFVSHPFIGRQSNRRVFALAMAAPRSRTGAFDGAIAASIDQTYFEGFYREVEPGFDHSVTLALADGTVLAREPEAAGDAPAAPAPDGPERIYATSKVGPYPVFVRVGISRRAALAPWYETLVTYGLAAAAASLALLAASALAIRQTAREAAARRSWAATAEDLRAEIAERGHVEAQLRQAQKMEAVGQLTGGIAHDFNNMLAIVIGGLDMVQRRLARGDADVGRHLELAMDGARRAATLTRRLLAFSRQQPLNPETLQVNELVAGMSELLRRTIGSGVRLETVLAAGLWRVRADAGQLENTILNLAINARDAMPSGGKLTIETANAELDEAQAKERDVAPGPYAMVAVSDTGTGMAPDVIARAFEPFFTTKEVGKGTGLGLSQVYGFVKQSSGQVRIYSEAGRGTTIKVYLPRLPDEGPAARVAAEPLAAGSGRVILVAEDDERVRTVSVGALRDLGFTVLEASDGPGALALLRAHPDVALLFTDVVMPGMTGPELADRVAAERPGVRVLFTTGYARNAILHEGTLRPDVQLLAKPFTVEQLALKVRGVLGAA